MNKDDINKLALQSTPRVNMEVFPDYHRHDVVKALKGNNNIGIELGVASGNYSKRMVQSNKFRHFFGVDLYEDHHNTEEYKTALKLVGIEENYTLLRMSFDDAISLFEDKYFDFIYFDGYAHTGEEGGKTFSDWYKKLKIGGIFAGDDYHDDWPLVKWAVNDMVDKLDCKLNVTGSSETTHLNKYPAWFFEKKSEADFSSNEELQNLGQAIRKATRRNASSNTQLSAQQVVQLLQQVKAKHPKFAEQLKELL